MASSTAYNAIKSQLTSQMGGDYPVYDWEEAEGLLSQSGGAFLALEEDFSDEERMSFGTPGQNIFRETGTFRIHVFSPAKNGLVPCRLIGESAREALREKDLTGGVVTGEAEPPTPGPVNNGRWTSAMIVVNYSLDLFR